MTLPTPSQILGIYYYMGTYQSELLVSRFCFPPIGVREGTIESRVIYALDTFHRAARISCGGEFGDAWHRSGSSIGTRVRCWEESVGPAGMLWGG